MIFVLAGTKDGRELALFLAEAGYEVVASVVSQYGEQLLAQAADKKLSINDKPLDVKELIEYIENHHITALVDASHPYAAQASVNAMQAARVACIPYIRYERDVTALPYDKVILVADYEEAAEKAAQIGKNIFLTTGSRNLKKFAESPYLKECVLTTRVLPTPEVISECISLGFTPGHIVALQGPFSKVLNEELYTKYSADVVITKNSGTIGGTDTKFSAASALNIPIIVIDRPKMEYDALSHSYEGVVNFLKQSGI